ncbi:MAG TPA: sulfite exporter TauE/SafE family protein [Methylomirabilota bacterium]|nr:sulfite exporter TauE/SafE family protein [Methylomirabilota bacterium]
MDLLIAVPLGFVLGFLIGLTGVGGGALVAPALYVILGLPYGEAVALSLIYSLFTKVVSAIQHVRQGTVLWKIALLYGLTGIPGAIVGSQLVYWADPGLQRTFPFLMGGVLVLVSGLMLMEASVRSLAGREKPFSPQAIGWQGGLAIAALQLFVGALLGITSIGSGSIVILSMIFLFRMSAREIVGSNIVIALIMVIPAGVTHYLGGGVDWRLLALLLVGSFVGAVLGSKSTMIIPDRALKLCIVALILAGAISTILKAR